MQVCVSCPLLMKHYGMQQAGRVPVCKHGQVLPWAEFCRFASHRQGWLNSLVLLAHRQGKPSHAWGHPPAPAPLALRAPQQLVWSIQVIIKSPELLLPLEMWAQSLSWSAGFPSLSTRPPSSAKLQNRPAGHKVRGAKSTSEMVWAWSCNSITLSEIGLEWEKC